MAIIKILLKVGINALAIYLASGVLDGVKLSTKAPYSLEFFGTLVFIGFVLYIATIIIKPLAKVLTFPLVIVTFGLFNVIINIFIIWGVAALLPQLEIQGMVPLILTTLIVSLVNSILFFI